MQFEVLKGWVQSVEARVDRDYVVARGLATTYVHTSGQVVLPQKCLFLKKYTVPAHTKDPFPFVFGFPKETRKRSSRSFQFLENTCSRDLPLVLDGKWTGQKQDPISAGLTNLVQTDDMRGVSTSHLSSKSDIFQMEI